MIGCPNYHDSTSPSIFDLVLLISGDCYVSVAVVAAVVVEVYFTEKRLR